MKNILVIVMAATLSACSTIDTSWITGDSDDGAFSESRKLKNDYADRFVTADSNEAQQQLDGRTIQNYTQGIMQGLVGNLEQVNQKTPVAVTSFVFLDGDFQSSDLLGNIIAENLIHEIHKFGIPIIDYKVTKHIRVTPRGDFLLAKDYMELAAELPIEYVLTGTLVKHVGGYLVNARMIGMNSKVVVGTAQSFIPDQVANALMESSPSYSEIEIR